MTNSRSSLILVNDVQGNKIDETRLQSYVDQMLDDNFRLSFLVGIFRSHWIQMFISSRL